MVKLEYKYLIDEKKVPLLLKYLAPYMVPDKHSAERPENCYTVRSIYYDTRQLDFYQEKLSGIKKRKKIRIRGYNELKPDSICLLEVKKKNGPVVDKERTPVYFNELNKLFTGKNFHISEKINNLQCDAQQFFYHFHIFNLIPIIKVCYERKAYFYKFNQNIRLTVDSNLRSSFFVAPESLFDEEEMIRSRTNSILEIKTKLGMPTWLNEIVTLLGLQLQALSKYALCLESHSRYERKLKRYIIGMSKSYYQKYGSKWSLENRNA